ncbi:MAG: radical SAM family heme chaperone HemW [Lachnospiraceae bacterium]|nr:radical SAM family heme chaperone HemW [Lachnospiraceae bacterium]
MDEFLENKRTETELYIHIPFCMKKCLYCDFPSGAYGSEIRRRYTKALMRELLYQAERMDDCDITTIYIGGGTPTWLEEKYMEKIIRTVYRYFHVRPDAEFTMECNPATAAEKTLTLYRSLGVNRLSIGLQSSDENELKTLGRVHSYSEFLNTFQYARNAGFDNVNVDIMTGIPGQTPVSLKKTLSDVTGLRPEHISCYSLIVEEGTPFYDLYEEDVKKREKGLPTEELPDEDQEYELGKIAQHYLTEHGYGQYEISNYAHMGKACRHNIGYWQRVPYLGVGLGAASLLDNIRYTNTKDIYEYLSKVEAGDFPIYESAEAVSRRGQMEEFMFLGLRMNEGVSRRDFEKTFGVSVDAMYGEVMEKLVSEGLLVYSEGRIRLTELGADLSNYALSFFLFSDDSKA